MEHTPTSEQTSISRGNADEWASWFRALGDPTRILILHLLSNSRSRMTVGEITDQLDVGQSTVSHHLAKLAEVGFVVTERVGTSSSWWVNEACIRVFPSAAEVVMGTVSNEFVKAMGDQS